MATMADWMQAQIGRPIEVLTKATPPPIFRLETGADAALFRTLHIQSLVESGVPILGFDTDARSGALRLSLDRASSSSVEGFAIRLASAIDSRTFIRSADDSTDDLAALEWRSQLSDYDLPVLGPGGRILVSSEADGMMLELNLRRRINPIPSEWRPLESILNSVLRRIGPLDPSLDIELNVESGYFEDSKYVVQHWLRPVLLFDVRFFSRESPVSWAQVVVEPLTLSDEVGSVDGLGAWAE